VLAAELEDSVLARQGLEKALRSDSKIESEILHFAKRASLQQKYRLVRTLLDVLEQRAPNSPAWNALQGYADYKLGNPELALPRLQRAIELDPRVEDYYLKIGELMLFHNSSEAALAFFEAGVKQLPDSASLHFGLAVCYFAGRRQPEKLREHLDTALKLQPSFEPALSLLCLTLRRDNEWPQLQEAAERLIRLNARSHEGPYYKAISMLERQIAEEDRSLVGKARELLEHSVRLNPHWPDARIALGKLLLNLNEVSAAVQELERAVELSPEETGAYFHLAKAYRREGQHEKSNRALVEFKKLEAKEQERGAAGWKVLFQVSHEQQ